MFVVVVEEEVVAVVMMVVVVFMAMHVKVYFGKKVDRGESNELCFR